MGKTDRASDADHPRRLKRESRWSWHNFNVRLRDLERTGGEGPE